MENPMKGNTDVVQALNVCLKDQLTAINQLFLHARIAKDWGLEGFNDHLFKKSIKAMKMADELIERVLFLEGLPNLQDLGKLMIGENVPEILKGDLVMLMNNHNNLVETIKLCESDKDYISRDELNEILEETEEHIDWIETQQWLISNTGLENYLQEQIGE